MATPSHRVHGSGPQGEFGDSLEELRLAFYARLRSEHVHFATLSAVLARAGKDPSWIFEDLQFRAHKMRGGAAIFEIPEVAATACSLEEAAKRASLAQANNTDPGVESALGALVQLLGSLGGKETLKAAACG
jgi:HPt (histidine-containing phosphotransfer) domain-containing protein